MEKSAGQVRKVLAEMGPGEYFGEMAALLRAPRTASVRCIETCHIAQIGGKIFRDILRENGDVSLFMLREFSKRIRHANGALEEMTQAWIRLVTVLYFLRAWPLTEGKDPVADLAKATARDAAEVREVLAALDRQGVLTFADGRVTAFNREEALRLVDEQVSESRN